jgi:L-amino acid N-acyltransferase YncA
LIVQGIEVARWVYEKTGGFTHDATQGLGWMRDGGFTNGFAFEWFNKHNMLVHQRHDQPCVRGLWAAVADYCFRDLGLERLTGTVAASNEDALRLNERIGFEREAVLRKAAHDGSDLIVVVLWRDKCRMLNWRIDGKQKLSATGS